MSRIHVKNHLTFKPLAQIKAKAPKARSLFWAKVAELQKSGVPERLAILIARWQQTNKCLALSSGPDLSGDGQ